MAEAFMCPCPACRVRALKWPLLLIATGVLFSLDLLMNAVSAARTWPVLLIAAGVLSLAERLAPDTGHGVGSRPFSNVAPPPPPTSVDHAP